MPVPSNEQVNLLCQWRPDAELVATHVWGLAPTTVLEMPPR